MRDWVPVPGTSKERLVRSALEQFGAHGYAPVSVQDIAATAGLTTGPLYHHFGGKPQLYGLVRGDVERRVADRVAGAMQDQDPSLALQRGLLVGYDWILRTGYARLVGEPPPAEHAAPDEIERVVAEAVGESLALVALAGWRSALLAAARQPESAPAIRDALARLLALPS